MKDLNDLNDERVKLIKDAQGLLDAGDLSAEKEEQFDTMMADADKIQARIGKMHKIATAQNSLDSYEQPKIQSQRPTTTAELRASEDYAYAFWNVLRAKEGAYVTPEIRNVLEEGTGTAGGFLVPTEFERNLLKAREEANVIRQLATVISTSSDREIPIWDTYGIAAWTAESAAYGETDDTFSQKVLAAHKMARLTRVSEELMVDSAFDMNTHLAESFGIAFGKLESQAFAVGSGVGQPTGLTLGGTSFALAGASITSDEILNCYGALKQPYRPNASWLLNNNTLSAVRRLKDGSGQYYFAPSLVVGLPDSILGKPVYLNEYFPDLAVTTNGVMLFGDFSYYRIGDRTTMTLRRLNELFAQNGQYGFVASARVDALPLLDESYQRMDIA